MKNATITETIRNFGKRITPKFTVRLLLNIPIAIVAFFIVLFWHVPKLAWALSLEFLVWAGGEENDRDDRQS